MFRWLKPRVAMRNISSLPPAEICACELPPGLDRATLRLEAHGRGHRLQVGAGAVLQNVLIRFGPNAAAAGGSLLTIGEGARILDTEITLDGEGGHAFHIGADVHWGGGAMRAEDAGGRLEIGPGCCVVRAGVSVTEGGRIRLGRNCLLAYDIDIRNGDSHGIWDRATGERINPAADVTLEDRVWLAYHVQVLKGVTIGHDTVVASNACVTQSLPAHCVAAGMPARVVRENVVWSMSRDHSPLAPPAPEADTTSRP